MNLKLRSQNARAVKIVIYTILVFSTQISASQLNLKFSNFYNIFLERYKNFATSHLQYKIYEKQIIDDLNPIIKSKYSFETNEYKSSFYQNLKYGANIQLDFSIGQSTDYKITLSQEFLKDGIYDQIISNKIKKYKLKNNTIKEDKEFNFALYESLTKFMDYQSVVVLKKQSEKNLNFFKKQYELTLNMIEKGYKSKLDLYNAEIEYLKYEQKIKDYNQDVIRIKNELKNHLFLKNSDILNIADKISWENILGKLKIQINKSKKDKETIDYKIHLNNYNISKYEYKRSKLNLLPNLFLNMGYDNSAGIFFELGIKIEPMKWYHSNSLDIKRLNVLKNTMELENFSKNIKKDNALILSKLNYLENKLKYHKKITQLIKKSTSIEKYKYDSGQSSIIELYEKQNQYYNSKSNLIKITVEIIKSQIKLLFKMGRLNNTMTDKKLSI
jgi:hypothetical protein